ncbi:hypothetical protein ACIQU4_18135 [Streptomyces sp. NPDC090741]|uniref:hypothetical protein n=1 Tax=Streptomyces sp. NPDC090741 TaxID=3365967 RepID=UPI00381ACBD5
MPIQADGVHRGDDHEGVVDGLDGALEVGASLLRRIDPDAVLPGALGERGTQAHARGLVGVDLVDQLLHAGAHMLAALGDREVQGHDQVVVVRRERAQTARVLGAAQPHRHRRSLIALRGEGRGMGAAQGGGPGRGALRRGGLGRVPSSNARETSRVNAYERGADPLAPDRPRTGRNLCPHIPMSM